MRYLMSINAEDFFTAYKELTRLVLTIIESVAGRGTSNRVLCGTAKAL